MIIQGDCIEVLKTLDENSVDAIVTDPPYELGFMGKGWDSTGVANNKDMWKECLRVLKPGGHLLSFGGTRTYHRMASAIEDAGFEIRDMIAWVYGCLSEDSEVLTQRGYRHFNKLTQYDKIAIYDVKKDIYKWERPQGWSIYKVHKDTAYRIKSDYTDQIVSRNHRCLVKRDGKLVFIRAEELSSVEYMPTLPDSFYTLSESGRTLLFKELLWKSERLVKGIFCEWEGNQESKKGVEDGKEPSLERGSNLLQKTWKLFTSKICKVSSRVFRHGKKGWLCNGTSLDNGTVFEEVLTEGRGGSPYKPQSTGQQTRESNTVPVKQGTQIARRARVEKIKYSGIIFCPTVSTGAFIARRNGQVFITGNSGFPKSLNIGKAVDKLQGNEREETDYIAPDGKKRWGGNSFSVGEEPDGRGINKATKGTSEWEGWGTALKPAHEPICMARKPLAEKTVAENVLKYGTGGINIDESRVEHNEETKTANRKQRSAGWNPDNCGFDSTNNTVASANPTGRFPANLIHDNSDEVRECFPETKGEIHNKKSTGNSMFMGDGVQGSKRGFSIKDNGNASRFFKSIIYTAKASKGERNMGLENFEEKKVNDGRNTPIDNAFQRGETLRHNNHPTVKPIALMEYLINMVTREGQIVLDPFAGSGSTLIAAKKLGRKYIGIELEPEYVKIAEARLNSVQEGLL